MYKSLSAEFWIIFLCDLLALVSLVIKNKCKRSEMRLKSSLSSRQSFVRGLFWVSCQWLVLLSSLKLLKTRLRHRAKLHWLERLDFRIMARLSGFFPYSMFPIKRTVFLCTVTVHKNTVHLIGNIEYSYVWLVFKSGLWWCAYGSKFGQN